MKTSFFAADGGVTVIVAALGVLVRKNSDDVDANLRQMTFTTTHAADLIRASNGFVFLLAAEFALHAGGLEVVGFTPTSLAAGRLVMFFVLFVLVIPVPSSPRPPRPFPQPRAPDEE